MRFQREHHLESSGFLNVLLSPTSPNNVKSMNFIGKLGGRQQIYQQGNRQMWHARFSEIRLVFDVCFVLILSEYASDQCKAAK
ncbi:hypothetical protein HUJ05_005649 [Dendroctonus ponderosae]|nr:hypothetical protein HUJ05_005649 [Dendroctonus ponderosae]